MNSSTPSAIASISVAPIGIVAAYFIGQQTAKGIDDHVGFITGAYWSILISSVIMTGLSILSLNEKRTTFGYVTLCISTLYFILVALVGAFFWAASST